jgi:transcriptional regulator with XRE-family HTH domain
MKIGARIKKARKGAKLTQQELANRVHITSRTLQWYESGDRTPPSAVLYLIAQETGRTMDWFYEQAALRQVGRGKRGRGAGEAGELEAA